MSAGLLPVYWRHQRAGGCIRWSEVTGGTGYRECTGCHTRHHQAVRQGQSEAVQGQGSLDPAQQDCLGAEKQGRQQSKGAGGLSEIQGCLRDQASMADQLHGRTFTCIHYPRSGKITGC